MRGALELKGKKKKSRGKNKEQCMYSLKYWASHWEAIAPTGICSKWVPIKDGTADNVMHSGVSFESDLWN